MNIREAVEAMKIIGPHAEVYTDTDEPIKVMRRMLDAIREENPIQALRLVALMEHKSVEQIAEELEDAEAFEFVELMVSGLARNRIINLLDAAFYLGMATSRWSYG